MDRYYHSVGTTEGQIWKFYILFGEKYIDLTVLANGTAWKAKLTEADILSQPLCTDANYQNNLKTFLASPSDTRKFEFEGECFRILLLLEDKTWMIFFSCILTQVNFVQNVYIMLDEFYNLNIKNCNELVDARNQYASIEPAYKTLEKKMNDFLDRRKSEEISLYNQFIAILNEKKRHIQHLNDLLMTFRNGRPTINPPVDVKRRKKATPARSSTKSTIKTPPLLSSESENNDSDNESNYHTDDELASTSKVTSHESKAIKNALPIPSTSKAQVQAFDSFDSFNDLPTQTFELPRRKPNGKRVEEYAVIPGGSIIQDEDNQTINHGKPENVYSEKKDLVNYNTQDLLDSL